MTRQPLKVLVVDDQVPFPAAARLMLSVTDDFQVVADASSVGDAVRYVDQHGVDVVLMDVNMAPMNGIQGARLLLGRPTPPLVVLCSTYDAHHLPPIPDDLDVPFISKDQLDPELLLELWRRSRVDGR